MKRRLFINSFSGTLLYFINIGIVFFISPVIVKQLGNRDYGLWDLILGLCGYLGLLEIGIGPAIIKHISHATALSDQGESNRVFVTSAMILFFVGLISLVVMALVALSPYRIFNISPKESPFLPFLCVLAGFNLFIQFFGTAPVAYLYGRQEHYRIHLFRIAMAPLSAGITYLALTRWPEPGLLWMSGILLCTNMIQYGAYTIYVFHRIGLKNVSFKHLSFSSAKALFRFGLSSFLLMLSDRLRAQSIPFVIGHVIGVASIVFYSIPARLINYASGFIMSMASPLSPLFTAIEAQKGIQEARRAWLDSTRFLQIFIFGLVSGLLVLGDDFIRIWMGPSYASEARPILWFLCAGSFVAGLAPNSGRLIIALGRHGRPAKVLVAVSVVTVLSAIFFARLFGLPGVAFVLMLGNVTGFLYMWKTACTILSFSMRRHFFENLRHFGPPVLVLLTVLILFEKYAEPTGYGRLFSEATAGALCYLLVSWRFVLKPAERTALLDKFSFFARGLLKKPLKMES